MSFFTFRTRYPFVLYYSCEALTPPLLDPILEPALEPSLDDDPAASNPLLLLLPPRAELIVYKFLKSGIESSITGA